MIYNGSVGVFGGKNIHKNTEKRVVGLFLKTSLFERRTTLGK
jgi:hypothetical protein